MDQSNEINEVQCLRLWPAASGVEKHLLAAHCIHSCALWWLFLLWFVVQCLLWGYTLLTRGQIFIVLSHMLFDGIQIKLNKEAITASRLAGDYTKHATQLLLWVADTHLTAKDITCRPSSRENSPVKSLACLEFHFPAIRFINNLFKHVLLCK